MRRLGLIFAFATTACFHPEGGGDDGSTGASTGTDAGTTTASTTSSTTGATSTSSTTTTAGSATETSTATTSGAVDESSSGSTAGTDTGIQPGCGGFDGRVVYVNMDGADLEMGLVDNAPANTTSNASLVGTWPGYTTGDADQVYEAVLEHWAPFDVCLTRELPAVPDYTMIVVSSATYQANPNFIGFANIDCSDSVPNSVNIVVLAEEANLPVATKAIGLSKHIAHTFGLESVASATDDIMNQFVGTTLNGATFTDTCYVSTMTANCDSAVACAVDEQQSGPYLENLLGPAGG